MKSPILSDLAAFFTLAIALPTAGDNRSVLGGSDSLIGRIIGVPYPRAAEGTPNDGGFQVSTEKRDTAVVEVAAFNETGSELEK